MNDPECLFCWNPVDSCICREDELYIKPILASFFVSSFKEFVPKTARKIPLADAIDYVNEWYDDYFDIDEISDG